MSRIWFSSELETACTFWRIFRRDGVTLGFTTHDRDLWFGGILHRASPGMTASSIRKSGDFEPDSAEVLGAITDDAIAAEDLAAGRFDGARVQIGIADWESDESEILYAGTIGTTSEQDGSFSCDLVSRKAELHRNPVPRTSPTCRAVFCGPGCNLNSLHYTRQVTLASADMLMNSATFADMAEPALYVGGTLHWLDGPQAGMSAQCIVPDGAGGIVLGNPLGDGMPAGARALLREGCDHTLQTCAERFGNAVNFRGEPFLPGNDMLTRYPGPGQ